MVCYGILWSGQFFRSYSASFTNIFKGHKITVVFWENDVDLGRKYIRAQAAQAHFMNSDKSHVLVHEMSLGCL